MKDLQTLLNGFLGPLQAGGSQAGQAAGQAGPLGGLLGGDVGRMAGVAGVGGLAGLLVGSKGGRKFVGKAATYGGLALLGSLAYKAYQNWQAGKSPESTAASAADDDVVLPPSDDRFLPPDESAAEDLSLTLVRAMIAAAKADGHIDAQEQQRLFAELGKQELTQAQKALVMDELSKPLDMDAVVAGATTPERAAEIYCASLMAIDPDGPAERGYLAFLAGRLKLDPKLVEHLHASVEGAAEPASS